MYTFLFSCYLIGNHLVSAGKDTINEIEEVEGEEVANEYSMVWSNQLLIVGPQGGESHDLDKTGKYLCGQLQELVNCDCDVFPNVRMLDVKCSGVNEQRRLEWFAQKHRLKIVPETEYKFPGNFSPGTQGGGGDLQEAYESYGGISWHADILDSTYDGELNVDYTGDGVHLFVLDTGFTRSYQRSSAFPDGVLLAPDNEHWHPNADEHDAFFDCNGHGTQVTFLAGGKKRAVAPNVTVHVVRISTCPGCTEPSNCGGGISYSSYTFKAIEWIIKLVKEKNIKKAIVTRSFSSSKPDTNGYKQYTAAAQSLAENDILWVGSAGNSDFTRCAYDYCQTVEPETVCPVMLSPNEPIFDDYALIVGATERDGSKASYSSWGKCVSQYIYGSEIIGVPPPSVSPIPPTDSFQFNSYELRGTSFSAPLAAGIAALFLEASDATVDVQDLKSAVNQTMKVTGSFPPNHGENFRVTYDLDSISELSNVGDAETEIDGRFYYCAPLNETIDIAYSTCFYKDQTSCRSAGSHCKWTSVPATNCRARSSSSFDMYDYLCKTVPNACSTFSSYLCVED